MELLDKLRKELIIDKAFDLNERKLVINDLHYYLFYANFISSSVVITRVINSLKAPLQNNDVTKQIADTLANESVVRTTLIKQMIDAIYLGDLVIITENSNEAIIVEARDYPERSIGEPDSEKVVRGSRDGFTENMSTNLGLIRRRVKNSQLMVEKYVIGEYSKTNVALLYFNKVVDEKALNKVKTDLNNLKINELTMSDKALEELTVGKHSWFPLVKYTERPDTFVAHLYQGMFGIIVDTSPSAILAPVSVFDHMQHAEEFRQNRFAGSYLRFIRFIGILITFLIIPLWYTAVLYNYQGQLLPEIFIVSSEKMPIFIQLILIELGIELVRMASIHTPNALATSMGLIAGIIIGDMAVEMGIFSESVVLLGALSAIGSYITPSYELSLANKMAKLIIIFLIFLAKLPGLIIGLSALTIYLATLKSFKKPYLAPLIPFSLKKMLKQLFRPAYTSNH